MIIAPPLLILLTVIIALALSLQIAALVLAIALLLLALAVHLKAGRRAPWRSQRSDLATLLILAAALAALAISLP